MARKYSFVEWQLLKAARQLATDVGFAPKSWNPREILHSLENAVKALDATDPKHRPAGQRYDRAMHSIFPSQ